MKNSILIAMLLQTIFAAALKAQYYSDRPLEMTFEQPDFFFRPSFVNPLGTANFAPAFVLTTDEPLIAIERNPANLSRFDRDTLPSNYFYFDFRNTRDIVNKGYGFYPRFYEYGYHIPRYGYYHTSSRTELTPLISAAYLTRLPVLNNRVTLGATYQLITHSGGYYTIPHDIYKNVAGMNADGMRYAGTENYSITDRFSGTDEMYNEGHTINTFLAWEVNDAFEIGLKIGRFIFEREGSLGSNNLWTQQMNYHSFWKSHEERSQDYGHWDSSLGFTYSTGNNRLGLYGGFLSGNANQFMARDDESASESGHRNSNFSDYQNWYLSDQNWDHKGNVFYSGFQWDRQIREELSFRFMYNYSRLSQDLGLTSTIESESENEYYYESEHHLNESEGFSIMHDFRAGSGKRNISNNLVKSGIMWKVRNNQALSLGAILGLRTQTTTTTEKVDAFSESYYFYRSSYNSTDYSSEYYRKTVEDKTINWTFDSRLRSIQIPVIYDYDINDQFKIMLGINRIMNFWKIENSTLVLYDYRERIQDDQQPLIEHNTGERIKEPNERLSIISTSLIGGITFHPSKLFGVRLVVSPGFEKHSLVDELRTGMQFWLGISLRP
ncbi:MAG: hypothetical protein ACFCUM_10150 [Bacteroidales bacterium]